VRPTHHQPVKLGEPLISLLKELVVHALARVTYRNVWIQVRPKWCDNAFNLRAVSAKLE
jgi:hypothetical protein